MSTPSATVALDPSELVRVAVALRGRGLSWLDGDASAGLGGRSHLAWDPTGERVARWGDGDPLAIVEQETGLWFGEPSALRTVVALAYDAAWCAPRRFGIRAPTRLPRTPGSLVGWSRTYGASLVYDHVRAEARLGACSPERLSLALRDVADARRKSDAPRIEVGDVASEPSAVHEARIEAALEAIRRGDLYQVNLARPFLAPFSGEPMALALAMRTASPVPLGAYLEGPDGIYLVARTMERFLSIEPNGRIESRPIKGTIAEQRDAERALLGSDKERAEHTMIVDLVRNDLGRIATTGTVRTPALYVVEPYAHLRHLVSVVEAELRPGASLSQVLEATFPPASISGAPKISAMEHIEALEATPRGFYTGTVGGIAGDGTVSLAVAIRTVEAQRGRLQYFAGGGIVDASMPAAEVAETELKARAFVDAVSALRQA